MGRHKLPIKEKRVPTSFACSPIILKDIERINRKILNTTHSNAIEIIVRRGITAFKENKDGLV